MLASSTLRISPLPRELAEAIINRMTLLHEEYHYWTAPPIDIRMHPCRHLPKNRLPSYPTSLTKKHKRVGDGGRQLQHSYNDDDDFDYFDEDTGRLKNGWDDDKVQEQYYVNDMKSPAVQLWLTFASDQQAYLARHSLHTIGIYTKRCKKYDVSRHSLLLFGIGVSLLTNLYLITS
jgi:hypothetical protein